jgi:iron complex outermembrane receptor protein
MRQAFVRILALTTLSALTFTFQPVSAQAQDDYTESTRRSKQLEAISITARKVEETLQEAPVAVSAFTGDELQRSGVQQIEEIAWMTPSLRFQPVPTIGSAPTITLRGLTQNDPLPTIDPSVGMYIDGVYVGRLVGGNANLLDVERMEVLKGPQGTLYGKNTTGGAINIISNKPDGSFGGWGRATLGSDNQRDFTGAVQFPILDEVLSARLTAGVFHRDGFNRVVPDPAVGTFRDAKNQENKGYYGRATVRWAPTDRTEILAQYYQIQERQNNKSPQVIDTVDCGPAAAGGFFLIGSAACAQLPSFVDKYGIRGTSQTPTTGDRDDLDARGASLTISQDFDDFTIKLLTGHRDSTVRRTGDADGTVLPIFETRAENKSTQFSQELQITGTTLGERLKYVSGIYWYQEKSTEDGASLFGTGDAGAFQTTGELTSIIRSWALYFNADYQLTDRLSLIGGIRTNYEYREMDRTAWNNFATLGADPAVLPGVGEPLSTRALDCQPDDRFDSVTWEAGLRYQVNDDLMTYGKASKGFRSGGFNGRASNALQCQPFQEEFVTSYEVGTKSEWLDNRLRANLAAYIANYTDIQQTQLIPGAGNITTVLNAGRAQISGGELELSALPIEGLELNGTLGVTLVRYKTGIRKDGSPVAISNGDTTSRQQPQNTPRLTYSLMGRYTFPPMEIGELSAQLDWSYQSRNEGSPENNTNLLQKPFGLLNGRVSLFMPERGLELALWGKNILDREYFYSGVNFARNGIGFIGRTWGAPRQVGVELTYRFGSDRS